MQAVGRQYFVPHPPGIPGGWEGTFERSYASAALTFSQIALNDSGSS